MKNALFVILLFGVGATFAQTPTSSSSPFRQQLEVLTATKNICAIDQDSRQCEMLQLLLAKVSALASESKFMEIESSLPPNVLQITSALSKEKANQLYSMELDRKIQTSRMYKSLDVGMAKVCEIKIESQPCLEILMLLLYQADVELGVKLNPPANIPSSIKQSIRKLIAEKHPGLTPSSQILLEATMLSQIQEDNQSKLAPAPATTQKYGDRKGKGICADKYSLSYDPQKCR